MAVSRRQFLIGAGGLAAAAAATGLTGCAPGSRGGGSGGGGTDINRALAYCQGLVARPADTVLVLISDLYEGGIAEEMLERASALVDSGVTMIALLALSDSGRPSYDAGHAAALAGIGVPSFACTPGLFPDLMAAAIERRDIAQWAAGNDLVTEHEREPG